MRWTPDGLSSDVEDRRGQSGGGFGGGGIGLVGFVILLVISLVTGRNYIGAFLANGRGAATQQSAPQQASPQEQRSAQLASFVLGDVQNTWTRILGQQNIHYPHARLVLFRNYTRSGCGAAQSATGPFYCPADQKVYLDLGFWDQLRQFGASGDFAQAYVIAHEIGHHVQNVIGIERKVRALQEEHPGARNRISVDVELQADCFAGIWAHAPEHRQLLEAGDIASGLQAAAAVGDDRLQKMSRGYVTPDSFTHGTSAQRMFWFSKGFHSGQIRDCNTFAANSLQQSE